MTLLYVNVSPGLVEVWNEVWQSGAVCSLHLPLGLECTLCSLNCKTWDCHETLSKQRDVSCAWRGMEQGSCQAGGQGAFSLAFAKCIYTWSSWPPLMRTSLRNIFHLSCSHAKKKLEIPPPSLKWNLSLFLTASSKTFIKETVKMGKKRQTRCFLTFHTKSCSQQDHEGLECQGEGFSFTLTSCFIRQQSSHYL